MFPKNTGVFKPLKEWGESGKNNYYDYANAGDEVDEETYKAAVRYALGYLYQNRECADHRELVLTLRALLMDIREEVF